MAPEVATGTLVWSAVDGTAGDWELGTVQGQAGGGKLVLKTRDGRTVEASTYHLANGADDQDDMTHLTHLHEPGVLHNLDVRYAKDKIYTCTGSILIAVNPFKLIPHLIGPKVMQQYQQQLLGGSQSQQVPQLQPHVYGTAVAAYQQMLRDGAGQAILITGESGAGKTETCKLIMRCLAHLGSHHSSDGDRGSAVTAGSGVEQKVLESNPLLEAFGNAKTSRNDNSSRFGKYVEIQFDSEGHGQLQGAAIRTYLLERSRVVHVVPGERSFHAFYQVCAGASNEERRAWHLGNASEYSVLRQSPCMQLDGINDAEEYQYTRRAMTSVGMSPAQQHAVFTIIAAVLHLGNVQFGEKWVEPAVQLQQAGYTKEACMAGCSEAPCPADAAAWQALQWAAKLLQVPGPQLMIALVTRTRQTPDGPITSPLTVAGAGDARDALCKVVYARLFAWIVAAVNTSLEQGKAHTHANGDAHGSLPRHAGNGSTLHTISGMHPSANGLANGAANGTTSNGTHAAAHGASPRTPQSVHAPAHRARSTPQLNADQASNGSQHTGYTIGLLDIYGFESFEVNDLEQLCINLANEKLQQHFNQHVFKWEQAEYVREGVDWRYIEFVDNQEVLDLVEGRLGLLDLLDEQCRFPTATAEDLAHKYSSTPSISSSKRFEKLKRVPTGFAIQHYAGSVNYKTDNFLDKNKDYVVAEHAALLGASHLDLVATLFGSEEGDGKDSSPAKNSSGAKGTPSAAAKSAFRFDSIANQFKRQLADLMSTLHAMQPHYVRCIKPSPTNKPGVYDKQYVLNQLRCGGVMEAVRISCAGFPYKRPYHAFLNYFWQLCPGAVHTTLHSARDGLHHSLSEGDVQSPHHALLQRADIGTLQAATKQVLASVGVEGYHLGHTKLFMKSAQAAALEKARAHVLGKAATRIQAGWRGLTAKRAFQEAKAAALHLQCSVRAWQARVLAEQLRQEKAATCLQAYVRAAAARKMLHAAQAACRVLQCAWRVHAARAQLHTLQWEHAATVLQSAWRARCTHQLFRQHTAATTLQSAWRARTAYTQYRQHVATVALQSAWRACTARRAYKQEVAATVLQSAWRARAMHQMFEQQIRACAAAVILQTAWRAAHARRYHRQELVRNAAAGRIQAAWRASRHGARLRESFRQLVLFALQAEKAVLVLQRSCRVMWAQKQLARLERAKRRQRFQQQVQRFQQAAEQAECGPAALFSQRSIQRSNSSVLSSPRNSPVSPRYAWSGAMSTDVTRGLTRDISRRKQAPPDVVREFDIQPEEHMDTATAIALRKEARLKEIQQSGFKLGSVLQMWQQREQAAGPAQAPGRAWRLPGGTLTPPKHSTNGSGSITSPSSVASYGALLEGGSTTGSQSVHGT